MNPHNVPMPTIMYAMGIFKSADKTSKEYKSARQLLRDVYGRTFVDVEYHENLEEFLTTVKAFYEELWREDEENETDNSTSPVNP